MAAPERIWATEDAENFGEDRFHTTSPMKGLTEYIRADVVAELVRAGNLVDEYLEWQLQDGGVTPKHLVGCVTRFRIALLTLEEGMKP